MNKPPKDFRGQIRNYVLILAAMLAMFFFMNVAQCPDYFTQEQIDNSRCTIGANIGLGLYVLFVGPVFIVVLGLLARALYLQSKQNR